MVRLDSSWWKNWTRSSAVNAEQADETEKPGGSTNAYEVLGVPTSSSSRQIHLAYMKLARRSHPDRKMASESEESSSLDDFHELAHAASILRDSYRRVQYDRENNVRIVSTEEWNSVYALMRSRAMTLVV